MNAVAEVLMLAPDVVSTTAVLLAAPHAMFRAGTLLAPARTTGATEDEKKLEGCIRVMVPPEKMAEVTGTNIIVGEASFFPAMRSEGEMVEVAAEVEAIMQIPDEPIKKYGGARA